MSSVAVMAFDSLFCFNSRCGALECDCTHVAPTRCSGKQYIVSHSHRVLKLCIMMECNAVQSLHGGNAEHATGCKHRSICQIRIHILATRSPLRFRRCSTAVRPTLAETRTVTCQLLHARGQLPLPGSFACSETQVWKGLPFRVHVLELTPLAAQLCRVDIDRYSRCMHKH